MKEQVFKFNFFAFIIAFSIGMFYVYIASPKPKIVIKYPTPYNANKIVYKNNQQGAIGFEFVM